MDRRRFLQSTGAAAAATALPWHEALAQAEGWRTYEIVSRVEVLKPRGVSLAWIPVPGIDSEWQKSMGSSWTGNAERASLVHDGKYGASMVAAQWKDGEAAPAIEVTSRFMTRDNTVDTSKPGTSKEVLAAADRAFYLAPTELIPTDGIVRDTARDILKGVKGGDVQKARAIYEWVVDNTFRDAKVRGCGWGDIKSMLETKNFGGKCGDLNAMFVGLARASGIPARDVYGLRVARSKHGYASLGVGSPNVTRAQHCRAEFFAQGYGWVPVDPADVRKVVLEEPPGNLPVKDAKVEAARKRLFGNWEMNWMAYNMAHDLKLPGSKAPKLPYLMYINAETGGEVRDPLDPDGMKYTITAREIA